MVHGDRESTAVCKSTLIRIPAPCWPKRSWRTGAISTRPITPQQKAQVSWAARLLAERAAVMLRSASIMEARHGEIGDWLIRESGSTRVKAELEWQFVHAVTLEAASFPHRMEGRILPLDEALKEAGLIASRSG